MSPIISAVFTHPLSDETFPSQKAATADYRRIKTENDRVAKRKANQDKINNHLRLTATSVDDVKRLMIEMSKEHCDSELTFNTFHLKFGNVSTTHGHPIGKRSTGWNQDPHVLELGWQGRVEGRFKAPKGKSWSFADTIGSFFHQAPIRFNGLHNGSGGGGNDGSFSYGLYFYLDDFPLLKAQHERALILSAERDARKIVVGEVFAKAKETVLACPDGKAVADTRDAEELAAAEARARALEHDKNKFEALRQLDGLIKTESSRIMPVWQRTIAEDEAIKLDALFK
jgi:hypothetical protein